MADHTLNPTPVASVPVDSLNKVFVLGNRIDFSDIEPVSGDGYVFEQLPANTYILRTFYIVRTQGSTTASFQIGIHDDSGYDNILGATPGALNGTAGTVVTSSSLLAVVAADSVSFMANKTEATAVIDVYMVCFKLDPQLKVLKN